MYRIYVRDHCRQDTDIIAQKHGGCSIPCREMREVGSFSHKAAHNVQLGVHCARPNTRDCKVEGERLMEYVENAAIFEKSMLLRHNIDCSGTAENPRRTHCSSLQRLLAHRQSMLGTDDVQSIFKERRRSHVFHNLQCVTPHGRRSAAVNTVSCEAWQQVCVQ